MKVRVRRLENEILVEFEDYVFVGSPEDMSSLAGMLLKAAATDGAECMDEYLNREFPT